MTENETPQSDEAVAEVTASEETAVDAPAAVETDEVQTPPIAYEVAEIKKEEGSVLRYCVDVQCEVLDSEMEKILQNLKKTVVVDGFRVGKAPLRLLKGRFGKDAEKDAIQEIAANITDQILEKDKLDKIGDAQLHDSKVEEGKPVRIEIDIEVVPQFDVEGYAGGEFEVEVASVTDAQVEEHLERVRQNNATYEEPSDAGKAFAEGDGATLDITVVGADGKRLESLCQENIFLRNPDEQLLPEVVAELVGKTPGETFTKAVERTVKNRQGVDVTHTDTYTVTLKGVKERVVPQLDDEFAKDLGDFETLDDLRKRIRTGMEEEMENNKREGAMRQIFDKLIEKVPFDAPMSIIAARQYDSMMEQSRQFAQAGIDINKLGLDTESYLRVAHESAERYVKTNLLMTAIAEKENLEASDEDVDKEIARLAEAEGRKPLAIRARLEAQKRLGALKDSLRFRKVLDFLMENNTIKVVEPKPAEKAVAEPAAEAAEEEKSE